MSMRWWLNMTASSLWLVAHFVLQFYGIWPWNNNDETTVMACSVMDQRRQTCQRCHPPLSLWSVRFLHPNHLLFLSNYFQSWGLVNLSFTTTSREIFSSLLQSSLQYILQSKASGLAGWGGVGWGCSFFRFIEGITFTQLEHTVVETATAKCLVIYTGSPCILTV